jgi:hypothetical protein
MLPFSFIFKHDLFGDEDGKRVQTQVRIHPSVEFTENTTDFHRTILFPPESVIGNFFIDNPPAAFYCFHIWKLFNYETY